MMRKAKWWLKHRMGWTVGKVATWWCGDVLMVGFRCECGDLHHIHRAPGWIERGSKKLADL